MVLTMCCCAVLFWWLCGAACAGVVCCITRVLDCACMRSVCAWGMCVIVLVWWGVCMFVLLCDCVVDLAGWCVWCAGPAAL